MQVNFEVAGEDTVGTYRVPGAAGGTDLFNLLSGEKNRIVAGVLALILGWVGAHKAYLGLYKPAKLQTIGGAIAFLIDHNRARGSWVLPLHPHNCRDHFRIWVAVLDGHGDYRFGGRNHVPHQVR